MNHRNRQNRNAILMVDANDINIKPRTYDRYNARHIKFNNTKLHIQQLSVLSPGENVYLWFGESDTKYLTGVNKLLRSFKIKYINMRKVFDNETREYIFKTVLNGIKMKSIELCLESFDAEEEYSELKAINNIIRNLKIIRYLGVESVFNPKNVAGVLNKIKRIQTVDIIETTRKTPFLLLRLNNLVQISISVPEMILLEKKNVHTNNFRNSNELNHYSYGRDMFSICKAMRFLMVKKLQLRDVVVFHHRFVRLYSNTVVNENIKFQCNLKGRSNVTTPFHHLSFKNGDNLLILTKMCKKLKISGSNLAFKFSTQVGRNLLAAIERRHLDAPGIIKSLTEFDKEIKIFFNKVVIL